VGNMEKQRVSVRIEKPISTTSTTSTDQSLKSKTSTVNSNLSSPSVKNSNQRLEIALLTSIKKQISNNIDVYPHLSKFLSSNIENKSIFYEGIGAKEKLLIKKGEDLAKLIIDVFINKKSPTLEQQQKMPDILKSAYIISEHVPTQIKYRLLNSLPKEKQEALEVFIENPRKSFLDLFRGKNNEVKTQEEKQQTEVITLESAIESFDKKKYGNQYDNLKLHISEKLQIAINNYLKEQTEETVQLLKRLHLLKLNPFCGTKFTRGSYNNKKITIDRRQFNVYHAGANNSPLRINYIVKDGVIHIFELVSHTSSSAFKVIASE
jgi:hypothetical protein